MQIQLYNNQSTNNTIGKSITLLNTVNAILKQNCSIENPEITLLYNSDDIEQVNYIYIEDFKRYYFCKVETLQGNKYNLSCAVDVLESFKDAIKSLNIIISDTESYSANNYLQSDIWVNNVKAKTTIMNFPNGLLDDGEFILITAGG